MNKKIPRTPFSTGLSGSAKETELRLRNIFSGPKKRPPALFLALVFALCLLCGNLVSCQVQAAEPIRLNASIPKEVGSGLLSVIDYAKALFNVFQASEKRGETSPATDAERYYEAGSLPLFQIAFSRLDEEEQDKWLEKLYGDGDIAFFSVLTSQMSEETLEYWLDRALEDDRLAFQAMLYEKLDRDDEWDKELDAKDKEWDAKEKEWAETQLAEYRAVGVTKDGKNYYYQGQLVNIFLDLRPNKSFYTLDLNPAGTVNIKILRDENGAVTGVAYMTEAEAAELLADME